MSLCLHACSSLPTPSAQIPQEASTSDPATACRKFYADFVIITDQHNIQDAQTTPVEQYPYLHSNRFLSSLKNKLDSPDKFRMWLQLLAGLGLETHLLELSNLPLSAQNRVHAFVPSYLEDKNTREVLQECSETLQLEDLKSVARQNEIISNTDVPANYHSWQRVIGLYPIVALPVAWGIHNWHTKSSAILRTPTEDLAVTGKVQSYRAERKSAFQNYNDVKTAIENSRDNPLAIPIPDALTLHKLFATFAPLWEVDAVTNDDRVGAPHWPHAESFAAIDTSRPTVYTLPSYTHLRGEVLLQLNYFVWFPARTCTSFLDFLCGHIDGLIWRVTIGPEGKPIIYDAVHNCGCYHTFFPTKHLQQLPTSFTLNETAFSPIEAPQVALTQSLVIRLAHRTHHVESLYVYDKAPALSPNLAWEDYNRLRSLPYQNNHNKSLFAENGLIEGTQRKERWFFWPFGITSAGAMRQWGTHATAFVGRRHFDDPYLIENSFRLKSSFD